ncbi:HAD-IIB family hydrolase [Spiroplasma apis]|uniref:HAD family hydrolase n=1 Tax=Spiroplasma apis B31 TaxID=1276258 RepID=V5RH73_SPIAP|nr:HAD-IIB family hydrolase [Spiroplasma apis]AHB35992.1 HAD family hydrolase [Spiroplasma apis B31]
MGKFKLVALDMDGTTYANLGNYIEPNVDVINNVIRKGVKVVFVTGRPVLAKVNKFEIYDFDKQEALVAGFNGALIYDLKNDKVIDANPIPKDIVKKAFDLISSGKFADQEIWAYSTDMSKCFVSKPIELSKGLFFETNFFEGNLMVFNEDIATNCYKLLIFNVVPSFVEELRNLGLEVAWHPESLGGEVTLKGINKKYAVEFLKNYYAIEIDEILAMGDGANDIPMLEYAGLSIAPANANDEVKKHAKVVSKFTHLEGSVAKELKNYVLGDN